MNRCTLRIVIVLTVGLSPFLWAERGGEAAVVVTPALEVPLGDQSALFASGAAFGLGGSTALSVSIIPYRWPFLYYGAQIGYQAQSTPGTAPWLNLITGGAGIGATLRMGNYASVQVGPEAGFYLGVFGASVGANPFVGASADMRWDLSPTLSIGVGAGYRSYLAAENDGTLVDLIQSARISFVSVLRPGAARERTKVRVDDIQFEPVFPVFYGYYDQSPLGRVRLTNGETSPITDVRVSFHVNEYMEQPKLSATIPLLKRGESANIDLNALFRSSVLQIITDTLVQAQIITEYVYLGQQFSRTVPYTLRIHGRNSMTWDDDRKAASFVNAKDPTVLLFSKNTAGLIRESDQSPINLNLRIAMGIFEALRAYGMSYVIDPDSSYIELSQSDTSLDTLLFPAESLTYRAGDCDDLAILYASLLESVGIKTAFITVPGHIFAAFSLGVTATEAGGLFSSIDDIIVLDDEAWLPVEITLVPEGFMRAWRIGARQWRDAIGKGTAEFHVIQDAWKVYEPAPTQMPPLSLVFPSREAILSGYTASLQEFIDREVTVRVGAYDDRIRQRGDSAVLQNRIGITYARYGIYADAERHFAAAIRMQPRYLAPLVNMGNVAFLRGLLPEALDWYQRAATLAPDDSVVLAGLARTRYDLEQFEAARVAYARLMQIAPELASEYSYIGSESVTAGRAASALNQGRTMWSADDGEE